MLKLVMWFGLGLPCFMAVFFLFGYTMQVAGVSLPASDFFVVLRASMYFMASLIPCLLVQLLGTAIGVRLLRGPLTVGFALPFQVETWKQWLFFSWNFRSSRGHQEGIRIFGVELAKQGDLSFLFMNVEHPTLPTYYRRFHFSAR